jgi:integrase
VETQTASASKSRGQRRARGSVSKNRVGNWQVRYTDPYGRRRVEGTYRRKADAEQALARVLSAIEDNTWAVLDDTTADGLDPKTVTLRQASQNYLSGRVNRQGRALSPNTANEYPRLLDRVATELVDQSLRSIRPRDIERWWTAASARTPAQASKTYSHIRSVMTYALKRKWIRENPCDIPGAGNHTPAVEPEMPTETEVGLMLGLAEEPMRTVVALAAYCGLRKAEILELRRKDFHSMESADGGTWWHVNVFRAVVWDGETNPIPGPPKTRASVRTVAIPKQNGVEAILLERLQAIPQHPETLLVSQDQAGKIHWSESMLNPRWRKLRAIAGYAGRFHSLRNFALTWYAQKGATAIRGDHTIAPSRARSDSTQVRWGPRSCATRNT